MLQHEQAFWWRHVQAAGTRVNDRLRRSMERAACAVVLCGRVATMKAATRLLSGTPEVEEVHVQSVLDCLADLYGEDEEDHAPEQAVPRTLTVLTVLSSDTL